MNRHNTYSNKYYVEGEESQMRPPSASQRLSRYSAPPVQHHIPVSGQYQGSPMSVTAQEFNPYNGTVYQGRHENPIQSPKPEPKPVNPGAHLAVGSSYSMYVSHVEDGPLSFYLQMKTDVEDTLPRLNLHLESGVPTPCLTALLPGSTVMTRGSSDKKLRRAIVKDVTPDVCTLYYADYGNTESVASKEIYELSATASTVYPLALKFSLANAKNLKFNDSSKEAFRQLVEGKLVHISVTSPETSSVVHFCEMYLDGANVKEIIRSLGSPIDYVGHPHPRVNQCEVSISFSDGPSQFFIQYAHEAEAIAAIQEEMNEYCPKQPRLKDLSSVHIGDPVAALYEDNEWYRAMVVGFHDPSITVLYVDYGNRWQVTVDMMCAMKRDLVTKWKTQAVECCLEGFESATPDAEVTNMFASLTEGFNFTMKVSGLLGGNRLVVDLVSDNNTTSIAHAMKIFATSNELDNLKVTYDSKGRNVSSEVTPKPQEKKKPYHEHDNRVEEDYSNQNWKTDDRKGRWNSDEHNDTFRSGSPSRRPNENKYKRSQDGDSGGDRNRDDDRRPPRRFNNDQGDYRRRNNEGLGFNKQPSFERKGGRYFKGGGGDSENVEESSPWSGNDMASSGGGTWRNRGSGDGSFREKRDSGGGGYWKNKPREDGRSEGGDFSRNWGDNDSSRTGGYRNREFDPNRKGKRQYNDDRSGGKYNGGSDSYSKQGGSTYNSKPYHKTDYDSNQFQPTEVINESVESWDDDTTPVAPTPAVESQAPVAASPAPAVTTFLPVREFNCLSIEMGAEFKAHLSHLDTPNHFYLQLFGSETTLDEIRNAIDSDPNITSRPVPSNLLTIGTPLISKYTEDDLFYRATVKQLQHDYVVVRFVDYGNTSVVAYNEVYSMTPDLCQKEMQAICCNLIDIKPATNDSWDPDVTYASYLEAEYLTVKVLGLKRVDGEEVFSVAITKPDGKNISQEFLNMKLALPVVMPFSPATDVEEPLLEGWIDRVSLLRHQYLHVTLLKMLPSKVAVVRLKDVDLTLLAESMTDQLVERSDLIMWIKSVEDNRVSVRFFSLDGSGLDGGEPICPITPMPILRSIDSFSVVHVEGTTLFVQKVSDAEKVESLLHDLYEKYSNRPEEAVEWEEGMVCCAQSNDANWYRARVIRVTETVIVEFLDYGNRETIPLSSLRTLDSDYYFPQLAIPSLLPCNWTQTLPPIIDYTEGHIYKAHIYRNKPGQWVMNLYESQGVLLIKRLINQGLATDRKVNPFEEINTVIGSKLLRGMKASVIVSHFDSPSSFWVHLQEHLLAIDALQANLQEVICSLEEVAISDTVFASQYSEDEIWYRAVEVEPGSSLVRFIDYGNTDTVYVKKRLPDELMKPLSGYAVPMTLCVKPTGGEWSPKALELFDEFIDVTTPQQKLFAKVISVNYRIVVDLQTNGKSLSEVLISGGYGTWDDFTPDPIKDLLNSNLSTDPSPPPNSDDGPKPEVSKNARIFVTTAISENDFYVQDESKMDLLNLVTDSLASPDNYPPALNMNVGDIVAALFSDDGYWYRAKVLSTDPQVSVLFIDYGNTSIVQDIKSLPEDLISIPPLATHCSLGVQSSTEASFAKFQDINFEGTIALDLVPISEGDPCIVKLVTPEGDDVKTICEAVATTESHDPTKTTPDLIVDAPSNISEHQTTETPTEEQTENTKLRVIVSSSVSLNDFYVQEESSLENLNTLTEQLLEAGAFPIVNSIKEGDLIAALSPIDYFWYRAKVLTVEPKISVSFIDIGTIATVDEIRVIPENLAVIPPFARHCSLIADSSSAMYCKFQEITTDDNNVFSMTVIEEGDPCIVTLMTDSGEDLVVICSVEESKSSNPLVLDLLSFKDCFPLSCRVRISEFKSVNDFYVLNINNTDQMTKLVDSIQSFNTDIPETLSSSDEVLAVFQDGLWHRAKVTSMEPVLMGLFVDHGLSWPIHKYRSLPDELKDYPHLSLHCSLGCEALSEEPDEEVRKLLSEECDMDILKEGDPSIVKLIVNGVSVLDVIEKDKNMAVVVSCQSFDDFTMQLVSSKKTLDDISSRIAKQDPVLNSNLSIGTLVGAQFPQTGQWHRARITELSPLTFFAIDYGFVGLELPCRVLEEDLSSNPPLGFKCCLRKPTNFTSWSSKLNHLLNSGMPLMIGNKEEIEGKIMLDLYCQGKNIFDLSDDSLRTELNISENDVTILIPCSLGPIEFYVQRLSDRETLEEMSIALNESQTDVISDVSLGDKVLVRSPEDDKWYRAIVVTVQDQKTKVKLIDYGKCLTVSEFRKLPTPYDEAPPLAMKCCLRLPDTYENWTSESFMKFSELTSSPEAVFHLQMLMKGSPNIVELLSNGAPLTPKLLTLCHPCFPIQIPVGTPVFDPLKDLYYNRSDVVPCYAVHIKDLSEFYIQRDKDSSKITEMIETLEKEADTYEALELSSLKVGDLVIARSSTETTWYRSKVMSLSPVVEVQLVDFGNMSSINEAKKLPDNMCFPPFAFQCSLVFPQSSKVWGPKALNFFLKVSNNGATQMDLMIYVPGKINIVDLILGDNTHCNTLSNMLRGLERVDSTMSVSSPENHAIVSFCLNPDEFYIQWDKDKTFLKQVNSCLEDNTLLSDDEDFKVGHMIGAQIPECMMWYRAHLTSITPELSGKLIDYGNSSEIILGKQLPEEIMSVPPLATGCRLECPSEIGTWSEEAVEKFLEYIDVGTNTGFTVTVLDDSREIRIVNLHYGPLDVTQEMVFLMTNQIGPLDFRSIPCVKTIPTNDDTEKSAELNRDDSTEAQ